MKKVFYLLLLIISVCIILCACGSSKSTDTVISTPMSTPTPTICREPLITSTFGNHFENYSHCAECGNRLPNNKLYYIEDMEFRVCGKCMDDSNEYGRCDGCGDYYSAVILYTRDDIDGWYCGNCMDMLFGIDCG